MYSVVVDASMERISSMVSSRQREQLARQEEMFADLLSSSSSSNNEYEDIGNSEDEWGDGNEEHEQTSLSDLVSTGGESEVHGA